MITFNQLWVLIKFRPLLYAANFLLATLGWLLFLIPAYMSKHFFDELSGHSNHFLGIWGLLILFAGGHIFRIIIFLINRFVDVTYTQSIGALIRNNIFHKLYEKPTTIYGASSGQIVNKIKDDVDEVGYFLSFIQLLDVIGSAIFAIVATVIMVNINAMITLTVFIPLLGVTIIAHRAKKRVDQLRTKNREVTEKTTGFMNEVFRNIQTIKLSNAETRVEAELEKWNEKRTKTNVDEALFGSIITSTYTNIVQIGTGMVLLLAAHAMSKGEFTVGNFALFTYFLTWITTMIVRFGSLTANYNRLNVSLARLNRLTGSPQATVTHIPSLFKEPMPEGKHCIQKKFDGLKIKNGTYVYPKSLNGIHDIDIQIDPQTLTVITGKVGSGKTTLLQMLIGVLPIQKGEIYWNQEKVKDIQQHFAPPMCSYIPQKPYLFSDSIHNNILLGNSFDEKEFAEVLHITLLEEDLRNSLDQSHKHVGTQGAKLSGGQKQRVATARAMYRKANLLIVDDLSSALDIDTEAKVWDRLLNSKRYSSIVAVTKCQEVLKRADTIIVLKEGKIIGKGKLDYLLSHCKEMQLLWDGK
ncbi:ATP-binding cassette subfamily B protein [Salirhabdus euzebyi]|uniref:ATP-binding cassette subfamily B protein n=1 Tax=Salirhabdus euzebyi TaxID=394506 RepID=A0A841Q4V0_9BACI|nr:ABC transporter ATP-binding protein [Salirhabdus euzebyi]MBB6453383.1 ATP-binding cassette subfamily B protein [Salirhabdus euzebyi]